MGDSPWSLKDICVEYICDNLFAICKTRTSVEGQVCRVLSTNDEFYLPSSIAEELVAALSDKGKIEDWMLTLFDSKITWLKNVFLRNASKLTINGLLTLQNHKISHLEVVGLKHATVNDLIECLGEWTLQNLQTLNVAESTFVDKEGYYEMSPLAESTFVDNEEYYDMSSLAESTFVDKEEYFSMSSLSKLQNLRTLNVRDTEFNEKGLEIVVDSLPNLKSLDISDTKVHNIEFLRKYRDQLQSLTMHSQMKQIYSRNKNAFDIICELHLLQHLDISDISCRSSQTAMLLSTGVSEFLRHSSSLPLLTSFDVTGIGNISIEDVRYFLVQHPNIRFLGLAQTDQLCNDEMFIDSNHHLYNPDLVVAGYANEAQSLEVLRRYPHHQFLFRVAITYLLPKTAHCDGLRLDIMTLIIRGMKANPKALTTQMYGMMWLEKSSGGKILKEINLYWLKQIVELVIRVLENFRSNRLMHETCLPFLKRERVFKRVNFDKCHCLRLVMDTMCEDSVDPVWKEILDEDYINEMGVGICLIATNVMSTEEKTRIGENPVYMKTLLNIIQSKVEEGVYGNTLTDSLSAMCNLTDGSLETCRVFIDEDGLDIFMKVIENFGIKPNINTSVLKVMLNIAEFKEIRFALMTQNYLNAVRFLLCSGNIDVSFYAAGITAYLASDGDCSWTVTSVSRAEMLKELDAVVTSWEAPEYQIIGYKAFDRLYPLLLCYETKEVQLWAVWTMHQSCSKNAEVLCKTLSDDGGVEKIQEMMSHPEISKEVGEICRQILDIASTS